MLNRRRPRLYLLKRKADAKLFIEKDIAMVEAHTGLKVLYYRTDNGGEFKNSQLTITFTSRGIQQEFTAPYQPDQNGALERTHRTIWGLTRAILHDSKLPAELWGEILMAVVFIWERSPHTALKGLTPFEVWHGHKPNISYFRHLGCRAHKLVPKAKFPKKLDGSGTPRLAKFNGPKEVIFDENVRLNPSSGWKLPHTSAMSRAIPAPEMVLPTSQLNRFQQTLATRPTSIEDHTAHIEAGNRATTQRELLDPIDGTTSSSQ